MFTRGSYHDLDGSWKVIRRDDLGYCKVNHWRRKKPLAAKLLDTFVIIMTFVWSYVFLEAQGWYKLLVVAVATLALAWIRVKSYRMWNKSTRFGMN